jgi:trans-2,3-dihydro-3-hydroxyanthranilate isomerase
MSFDFALVDVFSDRPFGGNQLAVFPDAAGIQDAMMQQLAREFNFSETTFVLPPADPASTCRVRIFTPREELPFAGHPTIGTAAVLADQAGTGARQFVFEEAIGPVEVTVDDEAIRFSLRPPELEVTAEVPPVAAIASALSISRDLIAEAWYAAIGLRFCFVRLAGPDAVNNVALDKAAWASGVAGGWSPNLYCFAGADGDESRLNARFFAPASGIDEDPATGSASAALAASIADRAAEPDGTFAMTIDQGVVMGRPSVLEAVASKRGGRVTEVVVGGRAVIVGTGTMRLPK